MEAPAAVEAARAPSLASDRPPGEDLFIPSARSSSGVVSVGPGRGGGVAAARARRRRRRRRRRGGRAGGGRAGRGIRRPSPEPQRSAQAAAPRRGPRVRRRHRGVRGVRPGPPRPRPAPAPGEASASSCPSSTRACASRRRTPRSASTTRGAGSPTALEERHRGAAPRRVVATASRPACARRGDRRPGRARRPQLHRRTRSGR